jgi:hypothetical protein
MPTDPAQEPEIGALPQFRNRDIEGSGTGVEVAVPVAVTAVDAIIRHGTVVRAAGRVRIGKQQSVDGR